MSSSDTPESLRPGAAEVMFLINSSISWTALFYVVLTLPLGSWQAQFLVSALVVCGLVQGGAVMAYGGRHWCGWCLHAVQASQLLAILAAVVVSGGPVQAPANYLLAALPAIAVVLGGRAPGLIWLAVVIMVELAALGLYLLPDFYVNLRSAENREVDPILVWTYLLLLVGGLGWALSPVRRGEE